MNLSAEIRVILDTLDDLKDRIWGLQSGPGMSPWCDARLGDVIDSFEAAETALLDVFVSNGA